MKRYLILLATVLLPLGILSGCAEVRLANTQAVSWQITPETQQESGKSVGVDSTFLLTLDGKLDEDQVRSCLQIEPAVEYQLQQQEDSVWELTPEEELKSGKVYAFQVKDRLGQVQQSFAFQTQAQLEVSSTYPEDGRNMSSPIPASRSPSTAASRREQRSIFRSSRRCRENLNTAVKPSSFTLPRR